MNELKKMYVIRDGRVFTTHVNRDGKLVDFRPCSMKIRVDENGNIYVVISAMGGVRLSSIELPCDYTIQFWPKEVTTTEPVRLRHATNISFKLDGQTVTLKDTVNLGPDPEDVRKFKIARDREQQQQAAARKKQDEALVAIWLPKLPELMKVPINRKTLLRWTRTGELDFDDRRRLFGNIHPPEQLKDEILRIEEEARVARKKAWLAAHSH